MELDTTPHPVHLFVCAHARADGQPSCGSGREVGDFTARLKEGVRERGLPVRVSRSGCLGYCELGPNAMAYPAGVWFRRLAVDDLPAVLDQLQRLIPPIHHHPPSIL